MVNDSTEYMQQDGLELNQALYARLEEVEQSMGQAASAEEIEAAQAQELADILREYGIEGVDGNAVLKAGGTAITLLDLIKKLQEEELDAGRGNTTVGCIAPAPGDRGIAVYDPDGELTYVGGVDEAYEMRFVGGEEKSSPEMEALAAFLPEVAALEEGGVSKTEEGQAEEKSFANYIQETLGLDLDDNVAKRDMDLFRFERTYKRDHDGEDADLALQDYIKLNYLLEGAAKDNVMAIFESYRSHTSLWQSSIVEVTSDAKALDDAARLEENVAERVAAVDPEGEMLAEQVRKAGVQIGGVATAAAPAVEVDEARGRGG